MKRMLLAAAMAAALPAAAWAGPGSTLGFRGWGPRLGITSQPDQVHFGAHVDFGNFTDHVRFQPNLEVGLGDHLTVATFNLEAAYRFLAGWGEWSPYVGGGIGLDAVIGSGSFRHRSGSETGASLLGGIEKGLNNGQRVLLELKLGLLNSPDLKLTTGWTFYHT